MRIGNVPAWENRQNRESDAETLKLRSYNFENAEAVEIGDDGGEQAANTAGVEYSRNISVENAFAAQIKLPHPLKSLGETGGGRLQKADGRIRQKRIEPVHRFGHGQRR